MGGQQKRKKNEDFKKVKMKVGKTKLPPANATDVDFSSKSINVPQQHQSVGDGQVRSDHGRTIDECLSQLHHYNPLMRKDGVIGITQIAHKSSQAIMMSTGVILEHTAGLVSDADKPVRSAILELYRYIFAHVPNISLHPHVSLLIIHTAAALTHIRDGVRLDALDLIDIWLEHCPLVLRKFTHELMSSLMSMLTSTQTPAIAKGGKGVMAGAASTSLFADPASKLASARARAGILSRLHSLLKAVLKTHDTKTASDESGDHLNLVWLQPKTWPDGSLQLFANGRVALSEERQPSMFGDRLDAGQLTASSTSSYPSSSSVAAAAAAGASSVETIDVRTSKGCRNFFHALFPVLIQCWLECSPSAPSGLDVIACMGCVVSVMNLLWERLTKLVADEEHRKHAIGSDGVASVTDALMLGLVSEVDKHLLGLFPFGSDTQWTPDHALTNAYAQMNLEFSFMLSRLLLPYRHRVLQRAGRVGKHDSLLAEESGLPVWSTVVVDYVLGVLQLHGDTIMRQESLLDLTLKTTEVLLQAVTQPEVRSELVNAAMKAFESATTNFSSKLSLVNFLAKTLTAEFSQARKKWVSSLPRLLWELGTSSPECTRTILSVLNRMGLQSVVADETSGRLLLDECQSALVPFFFAVMGDRQLYGPFLKLDVSSQQHACHLFYHFTTLSKPMWRAVAHCCISSPIPHASVTGLLLEILQQRHAHADMESFIATALSALLGYAIHDVAREGGAAGLVPAEQDSHAFWMRRMETIDSVCSLFSRLRDEHDWITELSGSLKDMCNQCIPEDAACGIIALFDVVFESKEAPAWFSVLLTNTLIYLRQRSGTVGTEVTLKHIFSVLLKDNAEGLTCDILKLLGEHVQHPEKHEPVAVENAIHSVLYLLEHLPFRIKCAASKVVSQTLSNLEKHARAQAANKKSAVPHALAERLANDISLTVRS